MSEPITARLFMSDGSQAVRIPKSLQLQGPEVSIARRGGEIVIREIERADSLRDAFDLIACLPAEIDDRDDAPPQKRDGL